MDDLLALMEGGDTEPPSEEVHAPLPSSAGEETNHKVVTPAYANNSNNHSKKKTRTLAGESADVQVDHRLGIRMVQRKMGSLDMMDFMGTRNFHTPASLAAMSLEALNQRVLVEPTPVLDVATVCGRTNLLTIGIVFSNSGTKIASSGKAFCFLTIGSNMQSGPSVSILLFGPAYSKYCQAVKPGLVVAVEDPRLIPAKPNENNRKSLMYDTAISFSINDERQLYIIAKAKDYGVCAAMVRGKNSQGHWVNNAQRCLTAIDVRISKYCQVHRKSENVKHDSINKKHKNGTFIQQKRQQLNTVSLRREGTNGRPNVLILPDDKGNDQNTISAAKAYPGLLNHNLSNVPKQMVKNGTAQIQLQKQTSTFAQLPGGNMWQTALPQSNNAILDASSIERKSGVQRQRGKRAPSTSNQILNPSKGKPPARKRSNLERTSTQSNVTNSPYTQNKPSQPRSIAQKGSTNSITNQGKRPRKVLHWLPDGKQNKRKTSNNTSSSSIAHNCKDEASSSGKTKAALNTTAMGGFDGHVPIPKPSRLFVSTGARPRHSTNNRTGEEQKSSMEDILTEQRRLAQRKRETFQSNATAGEAKIVTQNHAKKKANSANNNRFFDCLEEATYQTDREAIMNAQSRFATEAAAEAYTMKRRRVTELEQEEQRKEASQKKKNQPSNVVGKEWICRTCNNKISKYEPRECVRSGHRVVCNHVLNKTFETREHSRTKLNSKSVEDGGIRLGSGLEWSRFKSSRFS